MYEKLRQIQQTLDFNVESQHMATEHASSETEGQLVGAGKSLNGREKNSGEEKSRTTRRAPGDKVLTDKFQTVGVVLASDWCHKTFVFLCPIKEQHDYKLGVVSRILTP